MGKKHLFIVLIAVSAALSSHAKWDCSKKPQMTDEQRKKKIAKVMGRYKENEKKFTERIHKMSASWSPDCYAKKRKFLKKKLKQIETQYRAKCGKNPEGDGCEMLRDKKKFLKHVKKNIKVGHQQANKPPAKHKPEEITKGLKGSQQAKSVKGEGSNRNSGINNGSSKKPMSRGTIQKLLTKAFDNSGKFQSNNTKCEYSSGTSLRSDFDSSVGSCNSSFASAQRACDTSSNSELQSAMAGVQQAIAEVQSAQSTSVQTACQKFTNATKKLNSALNSFANSCDPAQSQCQQSCYGVSVKSGGLGEAISVDPFCDNNYTAMLGDIRSKKQTADQRSQQCTDFQKTVARASNDANELTNSAVTSKLCSQKVSQECGENSLDPSCSDSGESGMHKVSQLDVEGQSIKAPNNYDGFQEPENKMTEGDRQPASRYGAVYLTANSGAQASGSQSANSGIAAARQFDNEAYGDGNTNSASNKEDEDSSLDEESKESEEENGANAQAGHGASATSQNQYTLNRKRELRKYMPGGANDPDAQLPDGITGENGRSLFEKVSTRYEDHRPHLESFARQVKNMDKETLKARVRRKMTRQDHREEVRNRRAQDK